PEVKVRYQLAFTLADLNDSTVATAGSILATLAFKDFDDAHMMTAIKVSASRHLYSTIDAVLGRLKKPEAATQNGAKHEPPTPPVGPAIKFLRDLTEVAVAANDEKALELVLNSLNSRTGDSALWQFAGMAGLLDGLARKGMTLDQYKSSSSSELKKTLNQ